MAFQKSDITVSMKEQTTSFTMGFNLISQNTIATAAPCWIN